MSSLCLCRCTYMSSLCLHKDDMYVFMSLHVYMSSLQRHHTYQRVIAHMSTSHGTHINESWHTCQRDDILQTTCIQAIVFRHVACLHMFTGDDMCDMYTCDIPKGDDMCDMYTRDVYMTMYSCDMTLAYARHALMWHVDILCKHTHWHVFGTYTDILTCCVNICDMSVCDIFTYYVNIGTDVCVWHVVTYWRIVSIYATWPDVIHWHEKHKPCDTTHMNVSHPLNLRICVWHDLMWHVEMFFVDTMWHDVMWHMDILCQHMSICDILTHCVNTCQHVNMWHNCVNACQHVKSCHSVSRLWGGYD